MGSKVILAFVLLSVWLSGASALNKFPKMASLEARPKVQIPWELLPEAKADSYDGVPNFGDFPFDFEDFPEMQNFEGFPELGHLKGFPDMDNIEGFPEMYNFEDYPEMYNYEDFPEMENFDALPEMENFDALPEMENLDELPEMENLDELPEMDNFDELPEMDNFDELPELENFDELPEMDNFDELPEMENLDELPEMENLDELPEMENFDELPEMEKLEDFSVQNDEKAMKQRKKLVNGRGSRLISMEQGFGSESSKVVGKVSVESETREKVSDFDGESRKDIKVGSGRRELRNRGGYRGSTGQSSHFSSRDDGSRERQRRTNAFCKRMEDLCKRGTFPNACNRCYRNGYNYYRIG